MRLNICQSNKPYRRWFLVERLEKWGTKIFVQGRQVLYTLNQFLKRILCLQVKKISCVSLKRIDQRSDVFFKIIKVILVVVFYFLFCVLISITLEYVGVLQALYKNKMLFMRQNNLYTKMYSASFSEIIKTAWVDKLKTLSSVEKM